MYKKNNENSERKFESLEYNYLKKLIESYRSKFKKKKKRLYIGESGWSYSSKGAQLVLFELDEKLLLVPYRSCAFKPILQWLPNGELHVLDSLRLYHIKGGKFFHEHLKRRDELTIKDGDVYLNGVVQPPAALVPEEHLLKLKTKARQLAAQLLPPGSKYLWSMVNKNGKIRFNLKPLSLPDGKEVTPDCLRQFRREMEELYRQEQISIPESRRWEKIETTPPSYTESLLASCKNV